MIGLKIACIEEIAFLNKWIKKKQIKNEKAFAESIDQIVEISKKFQIDKIAAIESRGFVFASAVSYLLKKPFIYKKAYTNLKTNFMFHEDLVKILPKLINKKGIINVGGKSQSVFNFAKKFNPFIKKIKAKKNIKFPLNQTMSLAKLKKII